VDLSSSARLGKQYEHIDIRLDMGIWRLLIVGAFLVSFGTLAVLFTTGLDVWQTRSESHKSLEEARGYLREIQTQSDNVKGIIVKAKSDYDTMQDVRKSMEQLQEARLKEVDATLAQTVQRLTRTLDERLARGTRSSVRSADVEASDIWPVAPISDNVDLPTTVFGDSITIEWEYPGILVGKDSFKVQVSSDKQFTTTILDEIAFRDGIRLDNRSVNGVQPFKGLLFWRVARVDLHGVQRPWSPTQVFAAYSSALERIRKTGRVLVGTSALNESAGDTIYLVEEGKTRKVAGLDADVVRRVFVELVNEQSMTAVKVEFVNFEWMQMFEALQQDRVDMIASGITAIPAREDTYGIKFTTPYYRTTLCAFWHKDSGIQTLEDLASRRVFAVKQQRAGTVAKYLARDVENPASANYSTLAEEILKPKNRGMAAIADYPFIKLMSERDFPGTFTIVPIAIDTMPVAAMKAWSTDRPDDKLVEPYAIAVSAGEPAFLRMLNAAIEKMEGGGILDEIISVNKFPPSAHDVVQSK